MLHDFVRAETLAEPYDGQADGHCLQRYHSKTFESGRHGEDMRLSHLFEQPRRAARQGDSFLESKFRYECFQLRLEWALPPYFDAPVRMGRRKLREGLDQD